MNIREFITAYLKDRDMTMAELTGKLGYRSKTSIVRIMNSDVSARSLETFVTRLRKHGSLSEKEIDQLKEAAELLSWQDDYYPSREMLGLLQGKVYEEGEVVMECVNPDRDDALTKDIPTVFSEAFEGAKDIHVMLMNSQYVPVFDKLRSMIEQQDARISHYLLVNEDTSRTIHAMNVVFPIMFMSNYSCYLLNKSSQMGHNGVQSSDFMLANWTSAEGVRCESLVLFDTPNHARVYRSLHPGTLVKLLDIPTEEYMSIKHSYLDDFKIGDYVQFCKECADIERNRRLYAIKPDICLESIPVDIILAAAREGDLGQVEDFAMVEEALTGIFEQRFKNTFDHRKAHHLIMKRSALWKFVRTGRLSDHFWGLRPFTLRERATIIRHLIDQVDSNPYFHVYFLKDNQFIRDMEIFCYDGKGLLMVNASADYDLSKGYAEVMLDHPEFQRLYKDFYLKHLIREHVISPTDTHDFLRSLVEYCEDPNTENAE